MFGKTTTASTATCLALMAAAVPAAADQGPANDNLAAAAAVSAIPFSQTADTTGATLEAGEPQPSCEAARSTVWYRVAPQDDVKLVAQASAAFDSAIAVYEGTGLGSLKEVACNDGNKQSTSEFSAVAGRTYFVQLAMTGDAQGSVDVSLTPATWQERVIKEEMVSVDLGRDEEPIAVLDAKPRKSDPSMYEVSVKTSGKKVDAAVLTFGLVKEEIHQELTVIPHVNAKVTTVVSYRYDSSQYHCLAEISGQCQANSPIEDLGWLTGGEGARAELVISVKVEKDGATLAERSVALPFAGQLAGRP